MVIYIMRPSRKLWMNNTWSKYISHVIKVTWSKYISHMAHDELDCKSRDLIHCCQEACLFACYSTIQSLNFEPVNRLQKEEWLRYCSTGRIKNELKRLSWDWGGLKTLEWMRDVAILCAVELRHKELHHLELRHVDLHHEELHHLELQLCRTPPCRTPSCRTPLRSTPPSRTPAV